MEGRRGDEEREQARERERDYFCAFCGVVLATVRHKQGRNLKRVKIDGVSTFLNDIVRELGTPIPGLRRNPLNLMRGESVQL